ncbi:molecular chaperone [Stenotrophomonas maltophilia]|uniref:fimbrial biogenesis chaperone n=1 Tax=Stenotrophomonas maltophilia TaxID=40324 RepID=UPI0002C537E7|nr:fimbria/pilus periplasmic chaperone [Stenotrophomonas maltophilia]MBA0396760.1 molecular chaperone [Stenotrophomonas maltophilia]MBH1494493.1 molecular chaperone [Stenotrophomonas maltophilia]MBN4962868.1 molecular chaperone [Stenotrophomonas maltophilia]MBN5142159.1 molecular chaperone [Stenotrophomonas maltophilia]PJL06602.1 fimbrial chaperone protein [Stenotrophomonas maltophilia]
MLRLLLCLALSAVPRLSYGLELSSTEVRLSAARADGELWLRNTDATGWSGQARLYRWEQQEQSEVLLPADDVAVSPARLEIAAGQRQRLRLVSLAPPPAGVQRAYRLVISPAPDLPSALAIRYSLPVFLDPPTPVTAALQVQVRSPPGLPPQLWLHNGGSGRAQLVDLVFVDSRGHRQHLIDGLAGYVLPGRARMWTLPWRADAYAGGGFRARLNHAGEAALEAAPPSFAAAAAAGL